MRAYLRDRQVPLQRDLVDDAVHAGDVGDADAADDPPEPGQQRQVEQDGVVGNRRQQLPQVGEELGRGAEQDVVGAGAAGDEIRLLIGQQRDLLREHVAGERAGDREVDDAPVLAGVAPELGEGLADVAALGAGGAESLRGRVAEDDPERVGAAFASLARSRRTCSLWAAQ